MKNIVSLIMVSLLMSSSAFASVSVRDNAGIIPQYSQSALIANGSRWPFDLRVLTGAFPSPAALDNAVHNCVTGPNIVCIGIDPVHHKTNVHIGNGVGISPSSIGSLASAGNSYFKNGDYRGGIEAIASRATSLQITSAPVATPVVPVQNYTQQPVVYTPPPVVTSSGHGFLWFLFFALLIGAGAWVVIRARRTVKKINEDMNDFREEAFEMSSRNLETQAWHEKMREKLGTEKPAPTIKTAQSAPVVSPSVSPSPTTVVHNHYGNSSPSITGSGATDMLLGYELGRITTPSPVAPVIIEREVVRDTVRSNDVGGSSSNWDNQSSDAGGSSSDWNDDNSNSSDWDNNTDNSSSSDWNDTSDNGSSSDWGDSSSGDTGGDNSSDW